MSFASLLVGASLLAMATTGTASASRSGTPRRTGHFVPTARIWPPNRAARAARVAPNFTRSTTECHISNGGKNVNLDCDVPNSPNAETGVAVNPEDPKHIVVGSTDFDANPEEYYTSFDAGRSWVAGNVSAPGPDFVEDDPVVGFDRRHHVALFAALAGNDAGSGVYVAASPDGGRTWGRPVAVIHEAANDSFFNDKEWMVTDNNPASPHYGRTYLTWSRFHHHLPDFTYLRSPIFEAHSDDGGGHWSTPKEISGRSDWYCRFQSAGPAGVCDEDQFSVPTVGPDGTVSVAFLNNQHDAAWESRNEFDDQYLVVRSTDGGESFADPVHVIDMEDGARDYPENAVAYPTLTGVQFRVWAPGNVVADPRTGSLYLAFSDNRAGLHDRRSPVTNTKVFLMTSDDGRSWQGPVPVDPAPGDQFFPWADVNPLTHEVGIAYQSLNGDLYDTYLATGAPGRGFRVGRVSTVSSHPREAADLFHADAPPGCEQCTRFIGDYIGLAYGKDGGANVVWTDMRDFQPSSQPSGYGEHIYFAR